MHPNFHKEYQWHITLSRTIGKLLLFLHLLFPEKNLFLVKAPAVGLITIFFVLKSPVV